MSFFGRKLSVKGVAVGQATDKQLLLKEDYDLGNTLYYDTNGNPTVLLGNRTANTSNAIGNLQRGLFVSKAGINVTQATNSQLIFNSGQDVFKIIGSGTANTPTAAGISATAGTWTSSNTSPTAVPHGLPFIPSVIGFVLVGGVYYGMPSTVFPTGLVNSASFTISTYFITTDITNIYINAQVAAYGTGIAGISAFPVKYYILQETAN